MRATHDIGAGRSGAEIAAAIGVWSLVRDHVLQQGIELGDGSGQFRHNLLPLFSVDCVAKLSAQFFNVQFDRHLRLLDVCERWNRRGERTMTGQGSRQRPAEPARGGTDFVGAKRRQNWRGRVTLRRHWPFAILADLSRQGYSLVWHPLAAARQTRDRLKARVR